MNEPGRRGPPARLRAGTSELRAWRPRPACWAGCWPIEPAAWNRLVALYAPLVWNWCRSCGLQEQDQADIFQEVFQAVASHLDQFQALVPGHLSRLAADHHPQQGL